MGMSSKTSDEMFEKQKYFYRGIMQEVDIHIKQEQWDAAKTKMMRAQMALEYWGYEND